MNEDIIKAIDENEELNFLNEYINDLVIDLCSGSITDKDEIEEANKFIINYYQPLINLYANRYKKYLLLDSELEGHENDDDINYLINTKCPDALNDLIGDARLGLLEALKNYNPSLASEYSIAFQDFAIWYIFAYTCLKRTLGPSDFEYFVKPEKVHEQITYFAVNRKRKFSKLTDEQKIDFFERIYYIDADIFSRDRREVMEYRLNSYSKR